MGLGAGLRGLRVGLGGEQFLQQLLTGFVAVIAEDDDGHTVSGLMSQRGAEASSGAGRRGAGSAADPQAIHSQFEHHCRLITEKGLGMFLALIDRRCLDAD